MIGEDKRIMDMNEVRNELQKSYGTGYNDGYSKGYDDGCADRKDCEWKWESQDICQSCGYEIPHLERVVGETVLIDSKDWNFCPNCGERLKGAK